MSRRAAPGGAHEYAANLAWSYAAGATSGGEGAALSLERDRFFAEPGAAASRLIRFVSMRQIPLATTLAEE